jgi:hypothetical protein
VPFISKSRFLSGLQCPKLLWVHYHDKTRIPPPDAATQAIFDQGKHVGEYAKQLFPTGIEIGEGLVKEFDVIFERTRDGLATRRPLFEPALPHGNGYARADILEPAGDDGWDIVEVKSSTELKDVNIDDIAFQRYVFEGAGVKIRNCYLLHINNAYVRNGEIDPQGLFTKIDVTDRVAERLPRIEAELQEMIMVIETKDEPEVGIGVHCDDPYTCALHDYCWAHLPEHSVFTLSRIGKKGWGLYGSGIMDIADIPAEVKLSGNQMLQKMAIVSGTVRIEKDKIRAFLHSLKYPLYYLDFESINPAVPVYDGTRPYQQIAFQFSLHVVEHEGAEPVHHMFLAEGTNDPRPEFMSLLKQYLGDRGSIVVYNQGFEKGILRACADALPEYVTWYAEIEARIVDLLVPFRSMDYYHPAQHGSASIKAVLPVLTDLRYDGEIAEGATASNEYLRFTFGDVHEEDRLRVRSALEAYCGLDTLAMIKIVEQLIDLSK